MPVAVLAVAVLLGCSDAGVHGSAGVALFRWPHYPSAGQAEGPSMHRALIGTSWLAEDIGGRGVIDYAQTTISFDAEGQVSGSGGCNRYFGPSTIEENTIAFGVLGSTRRACPPALMDQEQKFFDALAVTRSYRFEEPGHKLVFLGEDDGLLVRFSQITP